MDNCDFKFSLNKARLKPCIINKRNPVVRQYSKIQLDSASATLCYSNNYINILIMHFIFQNSL